MLSSTHPFNKFVGTTLTPGPKIKHSSYILTNNPSWKYININAIDALYAEVNIINYLDDLCFVQVTIEYCNSESLSIRKQRVVILNMEKEVL